MMSADKIQRTLDAAVGNSRRWSGEFEESIPRRRRASRGGPYIAERIQFGGCPHYCARNSQTHAAGQKCRFDSLTLKGQGFLARKEGDKALAAWALFGIKT
jgi:hypothetical protein